ncbi:hypothetical protein DUNSADRAFT_665 [Dunaliella salina]|uniref:Encoded protein n=1 Tax=Dunaliella salina TaxID=3046 RepID=A0ABQ7GY15_DUNSA|nr:hypothetical protein DUNSADRAFT_665 [Dunaliella salina]|eukprot:KAF5839491.1 hypothetical protein DUNSADRAFT_665 [Dunaliella salina]
MKAPCFSPLLQSDTKPKIRGGVGKRKAAASNLMEQGWKANKKTSRSLTCEFERLTSASPLIKISNRAPALKRANLPHGAPSESPSNMRSSFQKGHTAASMEMHIDLDGRKPTPIPRRGPQLLLSPLMEESPYQPSARKAAAVQRSIELDSLALDLGSVLQFEQGETGSFEGSCCSEVSHSAYQAFGGYYEGSCLGEVQQWGACVSVQQQQQQQQQLQPPMALPPLTKCLSYG